ncbi:hypothetical protein XENORESO_003737 [Xenotaenia resolanae]|uniref:Uncharacterized protein n=1 Tax=Xenotaenia resolanae TaxID=208358 RepID=A0ABV0X5G0_9TELE
MMKGGERHRRWQTIAAVLLLCCLAIGLTYFSWRRLTNAVKVGKGSEVKEDEFNGKEFESSPFSAVATEMGLSDASIQTNSKEDNMIEGTAWRSSNSSLHCGRNKMKFKMMGPGATELQLDMGNADPVLLSQVPEACGILVNQTVLGIVLLVRYDSCAVKQENGTHVLTMRWRDRVINITCTILPDAEANTTEPVDHPLKAPLPHKSLNLYRMKRHLRWPPMYFPCSPYRRFPLCLYTPPGPPTRSTTTTTTTTAAPTRPPIMNPHFWKKLLDLYPLYSHYFQGHTHPLQHYYHSFKYPEWLTHLQSTQKPQMFNHPFHHFFEGYLTPTTTKQTTTPKMTTSSSHCPHSRWFGPYDRFHLAPRVSFGNSEIPEDQQDFSVQSPRSGYNDPVNHDSFWESFPLLYHSATKDNPHFDWEDLTSK